MEKKHLCIMPRSKKVALTNAFGLQFEHIRVNTQNVMSFVKFSLVIEYCIYWFIFIKMLFLQSAAERIPLF